MNKPTIHQSQIVQKDHEVVIAVASPLKRFINKYQILINAILVLAPIIGSVTMANPLIALLSFVLIFVFYGFSYLLKSDVVITKELIKNDNYKMVLEHIPYLDIRAKAFGNRVKVTIDKISFNLENPADLFLLTDVITGKTNLEFYENHQLSDKSEVITYKAKHIKKPIFSTFLNIQNQNDEIRIYDMTSNQQYTWLQIKKHQATYIKYSKPSGDDSSIVKTINLNEIEKIQVIIENRATLVNQFRQVNVSVLKELPQRKETTALQYYLNKQNGNRYIFKSNLRNAADELTNFRDGEKIYETLKELPSLVNIEIEKVILNA